MCSTISPPVIISANHVFILFLQQTKMLKFINQISSSNNGQTLQTARVKLEVAAELNSSMMKKNSVL